MLWTCRRYGTGSRRSDFQTWSPEESATNCILWFAFLILFCGYLKPDLEVWCPRRVFFSTRLTLIFLIFTLMINPHKSVTGIHFSEKKKKKEYWCLLQSYRKKYCWKVCRTKYYLICSTFGIMCDCLWTTNSNRFSDITFSIDF